MVLVVDHLGVAALILNSLEVGRAYVLADLVQGVPMTVVGFKILKAFGPNARIPARCRIQDPSCYQVGKDTDVPVAFSNGHLVDTGAAHIREVSLLARRSDMALKQAPEPGVRDAEDLKRLS